MYTLVKKTNKFKTDSIVELMGYETTPLAGLILEGQVD